VAVACHDPIFDEIVENVVDHTWRDLQLAAQHLDLRRAVCQFEENICEKATVFPTHRVFE
jgi:hypothetical protein